MADFVLQRWTGRPKASSPGLRVDAASLQMNFRL